MRNCKIILNPSAGQGRGKRLEAVIRKKISSDIFTTQSLEDARLTAKKFAITGVNPIIVCGGDGILNAVLNGILDVSAEVSIGFIPAGMSNVAALSLGIPSNPKKAIETIKKGQRKKIDVGLVKTDAKKFYFISMADFGKTAAIAEKAEKDSRIKKFAGKAAHISVGLRDFIKSGGNFCVEVNAKKFFTQQLIFCNGKFWGGKFFWSEGVKIDDGIGDAFIFKEGNFAETLKIFAGLLRGKTPKNVFYEKTGKLVVRGEEIPCQIDGEYIGNFSRAEVKIIPSFAKIIS